jgi:hypothetical protein
MAFFVRPYGALMTCLRAATWVSTMVIPSEIRWSVTKETPRNSAISAPYRLTKLEKS